MNRLPTLDNAAGLHTASGIPVFYGEPERTLVNYHDLEVHLTTARRYAGAIDVTIFRHLCYCVEIALALGYSREQIAYVACHDMHEAYVGDIPTGLKKHLGALWNDMEDRWEAHVHVAFMLTHPLSPEMKAAVKLVDMLALLGEMTMNDHPAVGLIYKRATVRSTIDAHPEYVALLRPLWKRSSEEAWDFASLAAFARNQHTGATIDGMRFNPRER